jgi:hypothetical protein
LKANVQLDEKRFYRERKLVFVSIPLIYLDGARFLGDGITQGAGKGGLFDTEFIKNAGYMGSNAFSRFLISVRRK